MSAADDLRRVQLDYQRMGTVLVAQMLHELAQIGEEVARDADADAPASKIHGSISATPRVRGSGITVDLRISHAKSKGAGPAFEQIGGASTFRHPLFGNRNYWYPQAADPFLRPALESKRAVAENRMAEVIEKAARASGWH